MNKELLTQIEREALKKVLVKLRENGIYELRNPVAAAKAKALYRLFEVEATVIDAYTLKLNK